MSPHDRMEARAKTIYTDRLHRIHQRVDHFFAWLMGAQWFACIFVAIYISPLAWEGRTSTVHPHVWDALILGAIIHIVPISLAVWNAGDKRTKYAIAVGQMFSSALLIHLSGGRIETHFHIFGSLAFLAFYREPRVLIVASAVVLGDHFFRGIFNPQSIYGVYNAPLWRTLEHGAWVVFENIFLIIAIRQSIDESRNLACQSAELEVSAEHTEDEVRKRTEELKQSEDRYRLLSEKLTETNHDLEAEIFKHRQTFCSLQEKQHFLEILLDTLEVGIIACDASGRITLFNRAMREFHGIEKEKDWNSPEHISNAASHIFRIDGVTPIREDEFPMIRAMRGERVRNEEFYIIPKGHLSRAVTASARQIVGPMGEKLGAVALLYDITEQKEQDAELHRAKDAAEAGARAKSDFLAKMSHEIRTPLNGVIGMTVLLQDTPLSPEQKEFAQTIRSSGEALLTIINDILDFSKIEAGKLEFECIDFDLREIVESNLQMLAGSAHAKGLELTGYVEPSVPAELWGDPSRLRQILTNLLSNSIKFTSRGRVSLHVSCQRKLPDQAQLHFAITDTGIGMTQQEKARLFKPFSQADDSVSRKFGGTGLGLAICKQLVEKMQGTIDVVSTPKQGATFWFTATFARQRGSRRAQQQDIVQARQATWFANARVLLTGNDEFSQGLLHKHVTSFGLRADLARTGEEAMMRCQEAMLQGDPYRVVVMDLHLTDNEGLALSRKLKSSAGKLSVDIVALIPVGRGVHRHELEAAGITAWHFKPVRPSALQDSFAEIFAATQDSERGLPQFSGEQEAQSCSSTTPVPAVKKLKILVAEDNTINQRVMLGQLRKLGYTADTVTNGLEALEAISRKEYDVILMDCQMPEMDGYQTTQEIRLRDKSTHPIRIVAMTANSMAGDREECLAYGMDDYISKPVRLEELSSVLTRCTGD